MSKKIEDAYNDCFERLLSGESLESCLSSYPQYAAELDSMLRTTFDIKRMAYPVQPRPDFKYWTRVRIQGIQQAGIYNTKPGKVSSFNMRRSLAISLAALLVFVMASTGTVAASSDALPDQPLYGVKLAVEQVQLTFTPSGPQKAELYAAFVEKRASEIAVMASQGKTDKVLSTTTRMYEQLDKAEQLIAALESSANESFKANFSIPQVSATVPPADTKTIRTPAPTVEQTQQDVASESGSKAVPQTARAIATAGTAKQFVSASTAKTIAILENARDKAPESLKPSLNVIIERTKTSNARINTGAKFTDTNKNNVKGSSDNNSNTGPNKYHPVKPRVAVPPKTVPSDNTSKPRNSSSMNMDPGKFNSEETNQSDSTQEPTNTSTISETNTRAVTPANLKPVTNTPTYYSPKLPNKIDTIPTAPSNIMVDVLKDQTDSHK